jgi:predicted hotdog family 3-hydroxylacyl-ACP dehydratase
MCLVDRLTAIDADGAVVSARLPADGLLVSRADGALEAVAYAELVAQSYAAFRGYQLKARGLQPPLGYLVSIRLLDVLDAATAGQALTIAVRTVGELEGFAVIEGQVRCGEELIAQARLKVFIPQGEVP